MLKFSLQFKENKCWYFMNDDSIVFWSLGKSCLGKAFVLTVSAFCYKSDELCTHIIYKFKHRQE